MAAAEAALEVTHDRIVEHRVLALRLRLPRIAVSIAEISRDLGRSRRDITWRTSRSFSRSHGRHGWLPCHSAGAGRFMASFLRSSCTCHVDTHVSELRHVEKEDVRAFAASATWARMGVSEHCHVENKAWAATCPDAPSAVGKGTTTIQSDYEAGIDAAPNHVSASTDTT